MNTIRQQQGLGILRVLGILVLASVATSAAAEPELDPVVADVVEMLQAGVDEGVVIQWLESTDRRPADVGPQGMIALTEANASEQLITALLQRVERPGTEEASREPAATGVADAGTTPVSQPTGEPPSASRGTPVEATIQLSAKRVWTEEDEPDAPREPPWWVYLYLDGEFIAWTRPSLQGEPVEARRVLDAGRHELRVVLQRYEELRGGWLHESLAVPTLVGFDASTGDALEIEVEMKRIWGLWRQRKDGGPLRYAIRQGEEILAENEGTGGDPNRWSPVCEDVEANFRDSDSMPRRFRNPMSRCVRWAALWTGPGRTTDRSAMLTEMAEYEFQPPVR